METARLQIRPFRAEDAPKLLAAVQASRPELARWLPWAATHHRSIANTRGWLASLQQDLDAPGAHLAVGLFDRWTGELVGGGGWIRYDGDDEGAREAEFGYWIRTSRAGQGLGKEAAAAVLAFGLRPTGQGGLGLQAMRAHVERGNRASERILEGLGGEEIKPVLRAGHPCEGRRLRAFRWTASL